MKSYGIKWPLSSMNGVFIRKSKGYVDTEDTHREEEGYVTMDRDWSM